MRKKGSLEHTHTLTPTDSQTHSLTHTLTHSHTHRFEASDVSFIQDDDAVLVEGRGLEALPQEDAIGDILDLGALRKGPVKAHVVANLGAKPGASFLAHALGHRNGSHAAGLRHNDGLVLCEACIQQVLRQLRRLS